MKKYTIHFLILSVATGLLGFSGINFTGVEIIRILFIVAIDFLIISLLARVLFYKNNNQVKQSSMESAS